MASKLSPEQKALHKAARSLRDKAFFARNQAYREALAAAKETVANSSLGAEHDSWSRSLDTALLARNNEVAAINAEIEALMQKLDAANTRHAEALAHINKARQVAWQGMHEAEKAAEEAVVAQYPDMVGCFGSPANWKPLSDFLPETKEDSA